MLWMNDVVSSSYNKKNNIQINTYFYFWVFCGSVSWFDGSVPVHILLSCSLCAWLCAAVTGYRTAVWSVCARTGPVISAVERWEGRGPLRVVTSGLSACLVKRDVKRPHSFAPLDTHTHTTSHPSPPIATGDQTFIHKTSTFTVTIISA